MKKTVFLLDDDYDEHEIFQSALRRINQELLFFEASNWPEAVVKLTGRNPDYIFVDLNMPRMDGIACVEAIRKMDELKNVPLYLYSTGITEKDGRRAREAGATDYITKPASFLDLCKLLRKIIR